MELSSREDGRIVAIRVLCDDPEEEEEEEDGEKRAGLLAHWSLLVRESGLIGRQLLAGQFEVEAERFTVTVPLNGIKHAKAAMRAALVFLYTRQTPSSLSSSSSSPPSSSSVSSRSSGAIITPTTLMSVARRCELYSLIAHLAGTHAHDHHQLHQQPNQSAAMDPTSLLAGAAATAAADLSPAAVQDGVDNSSWNASSHFMSQPNDVAPLPTAPQQSATVESANTNLCLLVWLVSEWQRRLQQQQQQQQQQEEGEQEQQLEPTAPNLTEEPDGSSSSSSSAATTKPASSSVDSLSDDLSPKLDQGGGGGSGSSNGSGLLVPSDDKEGWCRNKKYIERVEGIGWRCVICSKTYGRYNSVSYHVTIYHRNPPIACDQPGCNFSTREARYIFFHKYYRHQVPLPASIDLGSRKCALCSHVAKSPAMLDKHLARHATKHESNKLTTMAAAAAVAAAAAANQQHRHAVREKTVRSSSASSTTCPARLESPPTTATATVAATTTTTAAAAAVAAQTSPPIMPAATSLDHFLLGSLSPELLKRIIGAVPKQASSDCDLRAQVTAEDMMMDQSK